MKNEKKGDNKKKKKFDLKGIETSFKRSFNPSAKGCKIPKNPTLEGPFLLWTEAITFLSNIVKKATDIITGTKVNKINKKFFTNKIKLIIKYKIELTKKNRTWTYILSFED